MLTDWWMLLILLYNRSDKQVWMVEGRLQKSSLYTLWWLFWGADVMSLVCEPRPYSYRDDGIGYESWITLTLIREYEWLQQVDNPAARFLLWTWFARVWPRSISWRLSYAKSASNVRWRFKANDRRQEYWANYGYRLITMRYSLIKSSVWILHSQARTHDCSWVCVKPWSLDHPFPILITQGLWTTIKQWLIF